MNLFLLGGLVAAVASVFFSCFALCAWFGRRSTARSSEPKKGRPSDEYDERRRLLQEESEEEAEPTPASSAAAASSRETGRRSGAESRRDDGPTAAPTARATPPKKSPVKRTDLGHGVATVENKASSRTLQPTLAERERTKGRYGSTESIEASTAGIIKSTHFNASFASAQPKEVTAAKKSEENVVERVNTQLQRELEKQQQERKKKEHGAVTEAKPTEPPIPTLTPPPSPKKPVTDDSGVADDPFILPPEDEPLRAKEPKTASTVAEDKELFTSDASAAPVKVVVEKEPSSKPTEIVPTSKAGIDDSGVADTHLDQSVKYEPSLMKEGTSTEIKTKESSAYDVSSTPTKEEGEKMKAKPVKPLPSPPTRATKVDRGGITDKLNALFQPPKALDVEESSSAVRETEVPKSAPPHTGSPPRVAAKSGIADKLNALLQPTVIEPQPKKQEAVLDEQSTVPISPSPKVAPKPAPRPAPKPATRPTRSASESPAVAPLVPAKPVVQARKQVVSFPTGVPVLPVAMGKDSPSPTSRRASDGIRNRQQMLGPILMGMPGMGNGKAVKKDTESEMPISFDEPAKAPDLYSPSRDRNKGPARRLPSRH